MLLWADQESVQVMYQGNVPFIYPIPEIQEGENVPTEITFNFLMTM